jgi:hypothetical protein
LFLLTGGIEAAGQVDHTFAAYIGCLLQTSQGLRVFQIKPEAGIATLPIYPFLF